MMMPANYSAVAENEVIYGGASIADFLPKAWDASNVRKFNTNLITLVSNTFSQALVNVTLGVMFGGNWGKDGAQLFGSDGYLSGLFKYGLSEDNWANENEMNGLNKFMTVLGVASSIYTLGTTSAKEWFSKNPRQADLITESF